MLSRIILEIKGKGKNGDPFGKDPFGKMVFVKVNSNINQTIKIGDLVKCEVVNTFEKYTIVRFKDRVKVEPKLEKLMRTNGNKQQAIPVKTQQQIELENRYKLLKEIYPVTKVLNYESKLLIKENLKAISIVHHILSSREGPVDSIAEMEKDYLLYTAFLKLRACGLVSNISPKKWCFCGENHMKQDGNTEFVRRNDIRIAIDNFLLLTKIE